MADTKTLVLTIMDREYRINCPEGAESSLQHAGAYLNTKLREIKRQNTSSGKVLSADRIAVIAALNITHQMLGAQNHSSEEQLALNEMHDKIDDLLEQDLQLEL